MILGLWLSAVMTLLSACHSMPVRQYPETTPVALSGKSHPIMVKQILGGINLGQDIGTVQIGIFCIPRENSRWKRSEPVRLLNPELGEQFRRELTAAGYEVVETSDSLVDDPQEGKAEFLLSGILTHLVHNRCFPYSGGNSYQSPSGEASVEVEWHLYERRTRSVVYKTVTGGHATTTTGPAGGKDAYNRALEAALHNLLGDPQFATIMSTSSIPAAYPRTTDVASP